MVCIKYDDLGRIASVTRGAATKSGGKVCYRYNLHGQLTMIKGPAFTQNLHYTDGPGRKLYNGSVSAMKWTMGSDPTVRGYRYSYNGYNWLTSADYGEGTALTDRKDRYTERSLDFMLNGGFRRLQRHGLKADGNYGKVDNLHIYYDGNRITEVLEDADAVTQPGSMDYPGGRKELEFGYNSWGALVSDESRGIQSVAYDRQGNPARIRYGDGTYTEFVYSVTGEKLKMTHGISFNGILTGRTYSHYEGNVAYRDGKADMILFPGGYATLDGGVTFHYYTQDYLGNNRAVINGSTGAVEQTTAYYPYGGIIADLGNPHGGQPYRFGGKELITANGLNEYDFGARWYYPAVPGFTKPDNLAEKYPWLSPYLYCANNPVNAFHPDGNIIIFVNGMHFGDGGSSKYWNGVDTAIKQILQDKNAIYIDGSFGGFINTLINDTYSTNMKASNRIKMGAETGELHAESIYNKLTKGETIKIISHSMGGAAAKGFLQSLLIYAKKKNIEPKIAFEIDLAPFQWAEQKGNPQVSTYTLSHKSDRLAGESNMNDAKNFHSDKESSNPNPIAGHKIESFKDDVVRLIREGKIETSVKF